MVTVLRTNYCRDPRATGGSGTGWIYQAGTGEAGTTTAVTGASDGPTLPDGSKATTYMRRTVTTAKTGGTSGWYFRSSPGDMVTPVGQPWSGSVYVRLSVAVSVTLSIQQRMGGTAGTPTSIAFSVPAGVWMRLGATDVAEVAGDGFQVWATNQASVILPVGSVYEVTACQGEQGGEVTGYLDGGLADGPLLPDGSRLVYDWTGAANASTSTESLTDAVITAELITSAGSPPPVQVVLNGVPSGAEYVVTGSTGAGSSWPVPGGTGVGDGGQIVLVDNRSALNTPVTYSVVVQGATYTADPVTVAHDGLAVLQSLDGGISVDFVWLSNSLPREPQINTVAFNVPGRRRPPMRYAPGGDGGGELLIRADRENNAAISALLQSGRPILVRTDGTMRDWPAVELITLVSAPSRLWEAVESGQLSTQRVWSLGFLFSDDPEPSRVLSAWTWDDFDEAALVSFPTWDDFDALFAGSTWDDFDTTDWGQYQ